MNVAFFGTSDRSIPILDSLKDSEFNLVLCVTKEDRRVGRKQELKPTAVKVWADQNRVQCVTTKALVPESTRQIETILVNEKVELGVVADFSFMIPEEIFNLPEHKFVNIHFSLLPKYRGASPVQWAILNQEEKTGISYQIIDKKMDKGPIIHQTEYHLDNSETTESLYNTLFELCAKELPSILKDYVTGIKEPWEQNHAEATYTYSPSHPKDTHIFKEDAKINLKKESKEVDARVRAFNPWPIAWTTLGKFEGLKEGKNAELRVKIYETRIESEKLVIEKLQVEGKNMLGWKEFENGYLDLDSS
jgi:methionyl-tRNA formyltransferase